VAQIENAMSRLTHPRKPKCLPITGAEQFARLIDLIQLAKL